MRYFAGLFDAEGSISLLKTGNYLIQTEMTNEEVPVLFKETFGGNLYTRHREGKKKTFTWCIGTNRDQAMNFIENISPVSIVKKGQLLELKRYLSMARSERKNLRDEVRNNLVCFKQPTVDVSKMIEKVDLHLVPDINFFEWMGGFMDGDGNFSLYETSKDKWVSFQSWMAVFNIHPDPIDFVKQRLKGSISHYIPTKPKGNPIWKWVCSQTIEPSVCVRLLPFLKIKKKACRILMDYHDIKKMKVPFHSYANEHRDAIRDLIQQMKHTNS